MIRTQYLANKNRHVNTRIHRNYDAQGQQELPNILTLIVPGASERFELLERVQGAPEDLPICSVVYGYKVRVFEAWL